MSEQCKQCLFSNQYPGTKDDRSDWPSTLKLITDVDGVPLGPWAGDYYQCTNCRELYKISLIPRDGYYGQSRIKASLLPALKQDATLNQVWRYSSLTTANYFPISEYIRHGQFDVQAAYWQFKLELLSSKAISEQHKFASAITQLLRAENEQHKAILDTQGWLVEDDEEDLFTFMFDIYHSLEETSATSPLPGYLIGSAKGFLYCALGNANRPGAVKTTDDIRRKYLDLRDPKPTFASLNASNITITSVSDEVEPDTLEADDDDEREPDLKRAVRTSFDYLTPYSYFIPAICIAIFFLEIISLQLDTEYSGLAFAIFLFMTMVWYCAAAAKNAGLWEDRTLWRLARERISVSMDYVWFGLISIVVTVLIIGISSETGLITGEVARYELATIAYPCVCFAMFLRFWPFLAVPFAYDGQSQWSPISAANVWKGPGLPTAWRLTRHPKVFVRLSIPITLFIFTLFFLNLMASEIFGATARIVLLYCLTLPIVAASITGFLHEIAIFDELWDDE